jgi:SAM-dependent methyltransferase
MQTAVREMARVLKPNGRAVVLVPNTFSLLNNIWIALRQGRTSIDPYQPIQRYGARYERQELLEDNGLVVQKTIKYDRVKPRTRNELKTLLSHPKELARLILAPFVPLNLAFCFVFICHKANN